MMQQPEPTSDASSQSAVHWPSVLQLGLSLSAATFLFGMAVTLGMMGVVALVDPLVAVVDTTSLFLMAAGAALGGVLLLPSAGYAFLRLSGGTGDLLGSRWKRVSQPGLLVLIFPLALIVGHLVSTQTNLAWLVLPPLHLLVVGLPVLWIVSLGRRGLPSGSPQWRCGVFGSGLVLGPVLIMIVEVLGVSTW